MIDIYRLCKNNKYPVMHAYNSTMNLFPMSIAKITGVPVRISESLSMAHKNDWKTVLKKVLRPMSRLFANYYISCGNDCGRWQFGDKLFSEGRVDVFKTVIDTKFNAYNADIRAQTRKKFGWEEKIVIGHIGRFTAQKNTLRLIEIFASIADKEENAVMCLIGDGELKDRMMVRVKELGLEKRIDYLGRREDIQQFYNAMDAFLLPSLYEGLPVVGLEAESCGLPVFFSTEVTREANACELGNFISLDASNNEWAEEILRIVKENMAIRRDHSNQVAEAGFDSVSEALRIQKYYLRAISDTNSYVDNDRI